MTKLTDLCQVHGQSPWLDNLRRDWVRGGELARWIERGVRGVTSNPSIFQKAMSEGHAYDEQFAQLVESGASATDAYWTMAKTDIAETLSLFAPLHETSGGGDGFVSLELAPDLAHETEGSAVAARRLHTELDAPNLLVKIPATAEGVPAVEQMIAEGRSINITLIFSLDRYAAVMEAYLAGLERCPGDLGRVHSVASFFISRVDTEVDRRLDALGTPAALALRGRAAVAQAKLAHREFRATFSGPRWEALAVRGAHLQRPLWASTSTKNPDYPPTLYVDTLIGPDTVNTMPEKTLEDFEAKGTVARTLDEGVDEAEATWRSLAEVGVDFDDVGHTLEDEGMAAFAKSFDELITSLEGKAASQ